MPQTPRFRPVIRLFVSSTFSDMKHERNALQRETFPRLERLCLEHGFQFQAIDLRWGVSSEAGLDHSTMRICLDELKRSQEISPEPNFLILLGDRYGWQPLPEEMSGEEFARLQEAAHSVPDGVTMLHAWYLCDENAQPARYVLQSRRRPQKGGVDYTDEDAWRPVQEALWSIINLAWPPGELTDRFTSLARSDESPSIVRFQASATEQEIWHGALRVPDAPRHVLAVLRSLENLDEHSPEAIRDFIDLAAHEQHHRSLHLAQQQLKAEVGKRLGEANTLEIDGVRLVKPASVPHADITTGHLEEFCRWIEARLTAIIERQITEYWQASTLQEAPSQGRELELERQEHERFANERGGESAFVGRAGELARILAYAQGDSAHPLVVHGPSGCGKTALLARAWQELKGAGAIVRFLGVTPRSSDVRLLLRSLCEELRQRQSLASEVPSEMPALQAELQQHFQSATPARPVILFLDALDQLSDADSGRRLNWLPFGALPPHVKLIVSCLSDRADDDPASWPFRELQRRRLPEENHIDLGALSREEASALLFTRWLPQAGRTVTPAQQQLIEQRLGAEACRQPLYLKLVFEEARQWRSYDAPAALASSVPELIERLLDRLVHAGHHSERLLHTSLGYLAAARFGLTENELLEALFADPDYRAELDAATGRNRHELPAGARRIPIVLWSRLRYDVAPYFAERAAPGGNVLSFYHRVFREVIAALVFRRTTEQTFHHRLAAYFSDRWQPGVNQAGFGLRSLSELPFHQCRAALWNDLETTLASFDFLDAKARAGLAFDVLEDYAGLEHASDGISAGSAAPSYDQLTLFREYATAFRQVLHACAAHPEITAQQLYNNLWGRLPDWSSVTPHVRQWRQQHRPNGFLWLGRLNQAPETSLPGEWQRTLTGGSQEQPSPVLCLALSPDEEWLAAGAHDGSLSVWSTGAGPEAATFQAGDAPVRGVAWVVAGRGQEPLIAAATEDGAISLWDWRTATRLQRWQAHRGAITALVASDGLLISAGLDRQLKVWTPEGEVHHPGLTSTAPALCLAADAAGRQFLYSGEDPALRAMSLAGERRPLLLSGHLSTTRSIAVEFAKRLALSGGDDQTVRLWDIHSGRELHALAGHDGRITAVAFARFSTHRQQTSVCGVSAGIDETIRLWDVESGKELRRLPGHAGGVNALAASRRRPWLASAGEDGQVRTWDLSSVGGTGDGKGHRGNIHQILPSSGNQAVFTAGQDHTVRAWTGSELKPQYVFRMQRKPVTALASDRHGFLYSAGGDGLIYICDQATGDFIRVLGNPLVRGAAPETPTRLPPEAAALPPLQQEALRQALVAMTQPVGHRGTVTALVPLEDRQLLSTGRDGTIRLWNIETAEELRVIEAGCGPIHTLLHDPQTNTAVAAGTSESIAVLPTSGGAETSLLTAHAAPVSTVAMTSDVIAAAGRDNQVVLWRRAGTAWRQEAALATGSSVAALAFDPQGRLFAGLAAAGLLMLAPGGSKWEHISTPHQASTSRLLPRAAASQLVTAGAEGWVLVWELPSLRIVGRVHVGYPVTTLAEDGNDGLLVGTRFGDLLSLEA